MRQIEATILGQSYMLACPENGESLLMEAVALVDREMSAVRDAGKVKARERMAVLAALNLAYQQAERSRLAAAGAAVAPGPSSDTRVDMLVRRIDEALGQDGHLL